MNYTRKSILKKITKDFGSQIQTLPRKRKKNAKKLFFEGLGNLHHYQLALMLRNEDMEKITMELQVGFGKGLSKGIGKFVAQDTSRILNLD